MSGHEVLFPDGYFEREWETPMKGWLAVRVRLESGAEHALTFYDPVRLGQELQDNVARGMPCFAEPGLVVIPEVTTESVRRAVAALVADGFFTAR